MSALNPTQFDYGLRLETAKVGVEAMVNSMAKMNVRRDRYFEQHGSYYAGGGIDFTNPVIWQRKHAAEHAKRVTTPGPERERMTEELYEHGMRHQLGMMP